MWVRAVVAALAVWCVSDAAMAAGYTEVWNPPEASRHVAKSAKKKPGAGKAGSKQAGSKHAASVRHAAPRVASAAGTGTARGNQPAAHGSVKKVAAKGTAKSGVKASAAGRPSAKTAVTAQTRKPRSQFAQVKPGQGKVIHANLVQSRTARPQAIQVAAKTSAAKPAAPRMSAPAPSADVNAGTADAATNPATASSGSLPPILH